MAIKSYASSPGGSYIFSGTLGARPVAGVVNRYYWATDLNILYRDTGAAWEQEYPHYARWIDNYRHAGYDVQLRDFLGVGRVWISPFWIPYTVTVDRIAYTVGGTAAGNARMTLYNYGSLGFPDLPDAGTLIVETASEAQPGTFRQHTFTIASTTLTPNLYFVAIMGDDVGGTFAGSDRSTWEPGNVDFGRRFDQAYAAFTDPCPVTVGGYAPLAWLRVVSSP